MADELIEGATPSNGTAVKSRVPALPDTELTTAELVREITEKVSQLARKEVELARVELKADFKDEMTTVKGLGAGALLSLFGVNMLLVALAMALAPVINEWLAALIIGLVLLAAAAASALFGWKKRVKEPLSTTRKTIEEDVQWAKRRLA